MISNTKDIWRLESNGQFTTAFGQITTESWQNFPPIFFSISLAPTNIVVRVHTKNYGKTRKTEGIYRKTRKPLRRREVQENQKGYTSRPLAIIFFSILSTLSQHFNDSWVFSTNFVFSMPFVGSRGPKVCNQSVYHDLIA